MSKNCTRKSILTSILKFLFLFITTTSAVCQEINTGLTFQGYSGLLNTPNAALVPHGSLSTQYSDLVFHSDEYTHNNNLSTAIGVLPYAEIGGRIAWFDTQSNCYNDGCRLRDLSANVKVAIPFIPRELFSLAFGQQDIGGEANHFDTRFIVASKELDKIRLSLGWGQQIKKQSISRMEGAFGGLEYQPRPWLTAILEHDGESANFGARLTSPLNALPFGASLSALLLFHQESSALESKQFYGLSMRVPLARKNNKHATNFAINHSEHNVSYEIPETQGAPAELTPTPDETPIPASSIKENDLLKVLFTQLKEEGFERVSVGKIATKPSLMHPDSSDQDLKELVIAIENTIFSINDTDAIATAINIASNVANKQYKSVVIILKKHNFNVFWVKAPLNVDSDEIITHQRIESGYPSMLRKIEWQYSDTSYQYHKPRITVSPALSSAVATEFGVWDYSLAVEAGANVSLWKGAIASTSFTQPVDQSDDFEEGQIFYDNRQLSALKSYGIQQIIKVNERLYSSLFAGLSAYDYRSLVNESLFITKGGRHKFSVLAGLYDNIYETNISRKSYLASYRYYLPYYDLSSSITWGQFWEEDRGLRLDLKFWFRDTAVTLSYKDTDNTFVGLGVSLPLTPRKAFSSSWAQISGDNNWHYALQTQIRNPSNDLSFRSAVLPPLPTNLDSALFNEDRLNPLYIRRNTERLFEHAHSKK